MQLIVMGLASDEVFSRHARNHRVSRIVFDHGSITWWCPPLTRDGRPVGKSVGSAVGFLRSVGAENTTIDEDIAMPWSWKLVRIAGIDVYVHATFLMVVAWIALIHWNESQSLAAVVEGVGFILALFACVVLHEFGHALTAARYGIRTRDITLLPIGGWLDSSECRTCQSRSSGWRWPDRR